MPFSQDSKSHWLGRKALIPSACGPFLHRAWTHIPENGQGPIISHLDPDHPLTPLCQVALLRGNKSHPTSAVAKDLHTKKLLSTALTAHETCPDVSESPFGQQVRPHLPTHPCPNAKGSWEGCQANLPLSRTSSGLEAGGRATTGSG